MTFDFWIRNNNGPRLWLGFLGWVGADTMGRLYGASVWRVFVGIIVTTEWIDD